MARRIGASAYKLQIRNARSEDAWDMRHGSKQDGFSLISNTLNSIKKTKVVRLGNPVWDEEAQEDRYADQRAIILDQLEVSLPDYSIKGLFKKGEAGLIKQVYNLDDDEVDTPDYTIEKNQADFSNLYFEIHFLEGTNYAVAIFQTFGTDGLKGSFETFLKKEFKKTFVVKMSALLDEKVLKAFAQNGILKNVEFINSGSTEECRASMSKWGVDGLDLGSSEDKLILKLQRGESWTAKALTSLYSKCRDLAGLNETVQTPEGQVFDDVCVEIEQGGRVQRFSLMDPDNSPVRYDLTNKVKVDPSGFPSYDSLKGAFGEIWTESLSRMIGWDA